jgi:hypothetical protein
VERILPDWLCLPNVAHVAGYELVIKQKRFDGIKPNLYILENECLERLYNKNI